MEVFLARQPIFNENQDVSAYEILYRSGSINNYDGEDGDKASMEVVFNTFQTFGIENLTNGKPVFINFTEGLINDEIATLFSKELLVVEILEDVIPSDKILEKSKSLKDMGYTIALDDFVYQPEYEGLIEIADIIKIDFLNTDTIEILKMVKKLRNDNTILLAEKVETMEEFEFAKRLGFKLFQGYFFSKPEIVVTKKLNPIKSSCLQLVSKVNEEEVDFNKISKIVSVDLALTYNLLKLVNSSAFGFRYIIKTVRHALVALGEDEVKKWIYLIVVSSIGEDTPDELTRISLVRARFVELIALKTRFKSHSEELFLMGLFSLLNVILKKPMEEVIQELKAPNIVGEALIYGEGKLGPLYALVLNYEAGEWDEFIRLAEELEIDEDIIAESYMEALIWYNKLQEVD